MEPVTDANGPPILSETRNYVSLAELQILTASAKYEGFLGG